MLLPYTRLMLMVTWTMARVAIQERRLLLLPLALVQFLAYIGPCLIGDSIMLVLTAIAACSDLIAKLLARRGHPAVSERPDTGAPTPPPGGLPRHASSVYSAPGDRRIATCQSCGRRVSLDEAFLRNNPLARGVCRHCRIPIA